jgi:DmsE family decaheme c-type cytochrome
MRLSFHALVIVVVCLLVGSIAAAQAEDDGSEDCAMCHDDMAASFAETIHGVAARGAPSCVTCHGDGLEHMDEGGDPELIQNPTGAAQNELCLGCHQQVQTMFSMRSVHADTAIDCSGCHSIHEADRNQHAMLKQDATTLCATCHPGPANSFRRPYGHRLDLGGLDCASCHNPHGGAGEHSLKVDRSGDGPCVSCHAEKRGPFAFPHVSGIAGNCMSCHQPHGSTNPMALTRSRVDQLCLECHSRIVPPDTFGSQTPSSHNLADPRYRNCTTCHVAIHGSNTSPALLK